MDAKESEDRESLLNKLTLNTSVEVTEDEVAYFRKHPDEIDDFTAPVNIHKLYLFAAVLLGAILLGISKAIKLSEFAMTMSEGTSEFLIDFIFESGVALIGAAATAYVLTLLLNRQQENITEWRKEIRRRIGEAEEEEYARINYFKRRKTKNTKPSKMKMTTDIPAWITAPDEVETSIIKGEI
jgi:hypothetical protein